MLGETPEARGKMNYITQVWPRTTVPPNVIRWDFRGLLIARFAAVNFVGLLLIAIAWRYGLVERVWAADGSRLTVLIAAIFIWSLLVGGWRAWRLSRELDLVGNGFSGEKESTYRAALRNGVDPSVAAAALQAKLTGRITFVRQAGGMLVTLGLIGTVIGFIIALSGVDPSRMGDAASIGPMVATLIDGMGVALYTTLVGAVLGVWTMVNYRMLATGAANLYATILENVPCSTTRQVRSFATS